jgi:hypothetical protein
MAAGSFFALDPDIIDHSASQQWAPTPEGSRLTLRKSSLLTKDPARLRGVLSLPEGRAFMLSIPVVPPSTGHQRNTS